MQIIDLSHLINCEMPVYPGTEKPVIEVGNSIADHGFAEKRITMFSHIGTHIDAPSHILSSSKSLDQFAVSKFIGEATVVDIESLGKKKISLIDLSKYEAQLHVSDFLILKTGWAKYWGKKEYFTGFPVLDEGAAEWLTTFDLKGLGLDCISADSSDTEQYEIHKTLFASEMIIIENLRNLENIPRPEFTLSCLPLKFEEADGSPVRAVAMIHE